MRGLERAWENSNAQLPPHMLCRRLGAKGLLFTVRKVSLTPGQATQLGVGPGLLYMSEGQFI